mmetsp:Transcript_24556/g.80456  ORF Transcript_24556/g.80456 Transcript_24556/m.80456 type:complete len:299 (-) Transcript_24556:393-1289(-)
MASKKELPGYLRNTKSAERYFGVYEEDVVRYAFLPTSFVQLRKLPAKLKAGMIEEIRSEKPTRAAKPWQTESSLQGYAIYNMDSVSPRQSEMRKKLLGTVEGTLSPRRHTIAPKTFSSFAHIPNDYDFERQQRAAERAAKEAKIIGPKSMKTGVPVTLDKQGSFTHFRYESEPYQSRIETFHSASSASTSQFSPSKKQFVPGGRQNASRETHKHKSLQHELLTRLSATLRADWQASFERSYADKGGLIVCLFTDDFGEESGGRKELLRYMYNLVKSHPASVEYVLRKLPSRWGKRSNG